MAAVDDYSIPPWNMMFDHMTSMVDWCEPNYMQTTNVAEPANTASNLPFYVYALLLAYLFRGYSRHMGCCNMLVWILLLTVGICSTIFHATLSFGGQILDQISILWLIMAAVNQWLPLRVQPSACRTRPWLLTLSILTLTTVVSSFAWVNPAMYAAVMGVLGVPIALLLICELLRCDNKRAYRLGVRALLLSAVAGGSWLADRYACETWIVTQLPYFHALWHVLAAVSAAQLLVLFAYFDAVARLTHHAGSGSNGAGSSSSDLLPLLSYWPNDNTTWECLGVPYVQIAYRSLVRKRLILPV